MRERDTQRETDRQRVRQTESQTDRQTDRDRETKRQTDREFVSVFRGLLLSLYNIYEFLNLVKHIFLPQGQRVNHSFFLSTTIAHIHDSIPYS